MKTKPLPTATEPRLTVPILDKYRWGSPFHSVTLVAQRRDGVSYLAYNGIQENPGLTLIELPLHNRLRILFAGIGSGWIEVSLEDFNQLLQLARTYFGNDFSIFTTIHCPIQLFYLPEATA